ncbi:MAG: hypothetical protein JWR85_1504 [Marmoricola sp.]|nr:hypothetical protein [Marmoricola sp.]
MLNPVRVRHHQVMNSPTADRVVDALIAARLLDPAARQHSIGVAAGVLGAPVPVPGSPTDPAERRGLPQVVEVVAYLGGALVLAAGALFLGEQWDDLGFAGRVTLLAVVALVLVVSGGVASRVPDGGPSLRDQLHDSRRRLAGALLTGAALTVAFLVGHVLDEMMDTRSYDVYWPVAAGAAAGVLVAVIGYRVAPTALGQLAMMAGIVTVVMNTIEAVDRYEGDAIGVALFAVGALWVGLTELRWFRELNVARAVGVSTALVGAQVPVIDGTHSWLGYTLTVLVAAVGIAIYLRTVAWPYLAGAVLAVTIVVPEVVWDWTEDSLGAIGAVLVAGVTLLVASFAGYRLRAEAID